MKRMFLIPLISIALLFAMPAQAAKVRAPGPVKIGIVDVQKILKESKAGKQSQALFMKDVEIKRAQLLLKDKEIQALDAELKNKDIKMSDEIRKQKTDKLAQDIKNFKSLDAGMAEELKKKDLELTQKILTEVREILQTFSKKERYTIILEKGAVVTSDDAIQITDQIIRLYDAQNR
jgi:outer membrane protein